MSATTNITPGQSLHGDVVQTIEAIRTVVHLGWQTAPGDGVYSVLACFADSLQKAADRFEKADGEATEHGEPA